MKAKTKEQIAEYLSKEYDCRVVPRTIRLGESSGDCGCGAIEVPVILFRTRRKDGTLRRECVCADMAACRKRREERWQAAVDAVVLPDEEELAEPVGAHACDTCMYQRIPEHPVCADCFGIAGHPVWVLREKNGSR